jgi:nitrite reductase (NADH) large subunit
MKHRFLCTVCGYIHEGDAPPDECPVCGVGPEAFELMDDEAPAPVAATPAPRPAATHGAGLLILGGGIAALSAVEAARKAAPDVPITLVHREAALPYDRLSLTRLLSGEVERDRLILRPEGWFADQRIRLVHGEARRIDRAARTVHLAGPEALTYDRLLLATGAHAFVPPIPGARREGVQVLRTLADADTLLERGARGGRCVCIGGGLLGLETAGALARRGLEVTVCEEAAWLLHRQLAQSASNRLAGHLSGLGIVVRTGVKVIEIVGDETVRAVRLADGADLPVDLVVIAAGVRPNIGLARDAGLTVGRGVVVDDGLRTSDPDVLAAGDVAEHRGVTWGLWPVAMEQGSLAGRALAGAAVTYDGKPPPTQLKVVAWPVFSVGHVEAQQPDLRAVERDTPGAFVRIVLRGDVIVGGNLIGDTSLAGALRRAVQEGLPLASTPELRAAASQSRDT